MHLTNGTTSNSVLTSTLNGTLWDDGNLTSKSNQNNKQIGQSNGSNNNGTTKTIVKSQTVSVMQSSSTTSSSNSAVSKQVQPVKVLSKATSSTNVPNNTNTNATINNNVGVNEKKKLKNDKKKGNANADEVSNDEFGAWCSKALTSHGNVIDGTY